MSDPASMSLDDYIKTQRKKGNFGRRRGGGGGGGGIRSNNRGGGGGNSAGNNRGNNSFRGRRGRQGGNNNVQRRGNRGFGNRNRALTTKSGRGNIQQRFGGGIGQGQSRRNRSLQGNRNLNLNSSINRQQRRRQRNSGAGVGNQGGRQQGGPKQLRYFSNAGAAQAVGNPRRGASRRLRRNRQSVPGLRGNGNVAVGGVKMAAATKKAFLKLAKKRVQRAKLLVSKKKTIRGAAIPKLLSASSTGRVALGKNGFFTVRNTKSKQVERSMVQMKIARAQKARNRISPQQQRAPNMPGSSGAANRSVSRGMASRSVNRGRGPSAIASGHPRPLDWNTSIVRTMRNDLVDDMTNSQLNPEIQQRIAFIQSRSSRDRAPVMQDFKAPVSTSRMKLSDRFRLLSDR